MSCCPTVHSTQWVPRSKACENPTLAHLGTFFSVRVCMCLGLSVCSFVRLWSLGKKRVFTLKQQLCAPGQYISPTSFYFSNQGNQVTWWLTPSKDYPVFSQLHWDDGFSSSLQCFPCIEVHCFCAPLDISQHGWGWLYLFTIFRAISKSRVNIYILKPAYLSWTFVAVTTCCL